VYHLTVLFLPTTNCIKKELNGLFSERRLPMLTIHATCTYFCSTVHKEGCDQQGICDINNVVNSSFTCCCEPGRFTICTPNFILWNATYLCDAI